MPWITKEGRSVDEARAAAIAESRLDEAELDIEVVNEGAKGLFGLGGEPAVVRVRPKSEATDFRGAFQDDITPGPDAKREPRPVPQRPAADEADDLEGDDYDDGPPITVPADAGDDDIDDSEDKRSTAERQEQAAELGVEIIRGILERMELEGDINTRVAGGTVYIEVFGEEMGILIGRSGTTLEALQELVRAGIQRRLKTRQAVVVDVENYWERRRKPQRREGGGREGGGGQRGGQRRGRRSGGRRGGGGRGRDPNRKPEAGPEPDGNTTSSS
jgi:spoIIIJ-associated protein